MLNRKFSFNSFQLKIIGIITMTVDHIGYFFSSYLSDSILGVETYMILRLIGRIAFPIFAFLCAIAVIKTSNFKMYFLKLFSFGLLIQLFLIVIGETTGNVFLTLAFGSLISYGFINQKYMLCFISLVVGVLNGYSHVTFLDYNLYGILVVFFFTLLLYYQSFTKLNLFLGLITLSVLLLPSNILSVLAIPFISSYNFKKGLSIKYFFYIYYPLHIGVLNLILLKMHK